MKSEDNPEANNSSFDKNKLHKIIKEGRKKGRQQGLSELQGSFNYFQAHAINEDHLIEMFHDYFLQCQNDFSGLRSYYKSAVLSFRHTKKKIVPSKWLIDGEVKPVSQEELDYISEMYLVFAKTKPDFGSGINIEEELEDLESVVVEFEKIQIKKLQIDWVIQETNKKIKEKNNPEQVKNLEEKDLFNTVWEAVLYHSVLVDHDQKKFFRSKKEIPALVQEMYKPDGKAISHNTFYQKLQKINEASKGIPDSKHGKYTMKDYQAVEKRLSSEYPQALGLLKENYYYPELY